MTNAPGGGWVVFACRTSFTAEIVEIVARRGESVALLVDNLPDGPERSPIAPVVASSALPAGSLQGPVVIPLTTPGYRYIAAVEARELGATSFPCLVDPTTTIARSATVGDGSVVNAGAVVAANTHVGSFVHVNRSASVGHDVRLDDYVTLGPACALAGGVTVARGAFIAVGAICAPNVAVGTNAVVGAGAVVVRDVPADTTVVGNPARVLRDDTPGYAGARVPLDP
jgi:sugar O-acyltransferase (sialic acid O-acetyltransferase NeuD family)